MRRIVVCLLVVLAVLLAAEVRLSRGDHRLVGPPPTVLWEHSEPPGRPSPTPVVTRSDRGLTVTYSPASNCVSLVSTDPNSQYTLTGVEDGVLFDIDGDGDLDRVAWTQPASDVAFLALDRDGDGRITSGRELIGDHTLPGATNAPNALFQLAAAHPGTWGHVDSDNPLFAQFLLWRDRNHNGISEPGELRPAEDELATIGLGYGSHRRIDSHGNQSRFQGYVHVRTEPGKNNPGGADDDRARVRHMYDVCLVSR